MKNLHYITMVALLAFFGLFLLLPLETVLERGLDPAVIAEVCRSPVCREGLLNSLLIALATTALVGAIALPLAWLQHRWDFRGKAWVTPLLLLPLILPPFVGALGIQQIFGHYGALNSALGHVGIAPIPWLDGNGRFWVVCLVEALHLYPILYLNIAAAFASLDPAYDEAARCLGASGWRRFWKIQLPLVRPGVFAGGTLVLIWSFTELGTPLMLGYHRVTPVQIFNGILELDANPLPYVLVAVLLAASAGLYAAARLINGSPAAAATKGTGNATATARLSGWRGLLALLPFLGIAGLAVLPHLGIVLLASSGDWYQTELPTTWTLEHFRNALSHPMVVPSIINSLRYSLLAMVICVAAGLATALLAVRWKPRGWQVLDTLAMLPLAVPGLVIAFGYLSMATRFPWLRAWLDPFRDPTLLLAAAYAMRRLPYAVRVAAAGLEQIPEEFELAARNLGAGLWRTLRKITGPLLITSLAVAALFAFSFSMLEVSDSLLLAQKREFYPIPRAIYDLSQVLGSGLRLACALGTWAMLFLAATLALAAALIGRKLGGLFRM
jgi:iron(III) transport system permease protein